MFTRDRDLAILRMKIEQGGDMGNLYESESSRQNEQRIARRIASKWNCSTRKLTVPYRIDFVLESGGELKAWLEVKCRNYPSTRYSTLMISVLKWETGILHEQATGLPFIIAIEFTDCIKYYTYKKTDEVRYAWGGRTRSPRDTSDFEPVVHIPMELFKTLKTARDGIAA
jgi:hypothetical protein